MIKIVFEDKEIEKIEDSPYLAKEYVHKHKSIFDNKAKIYVEAIYPIIIKTITKYNQYTWYSYWIFHKGKITIYQFDRKPNKEEYQRMIEEVINDL